MFYFVAVWSVLAAISWLIGIALLKALQADCFERNGDRTMVALWLGIVILADGLLLISLRLPLSPLVGAAVGLGVSLLLLSWHSVRTEVRRLRKASSIPIVLTPGVWMLLTAIYMTQRVTWFDTGLYHFGAIRWLSEFGAVPGLALLLDNFGFTSSWFALAAPLNAETLASHVSAVTNGFVLLVATWQGLFALWTWMIGKARFADKFIVVFLGFVLPALTQTTFLSAIIISPSPDIPVIFLTGIVAWSILIISDKNQSTHNFEKPKNFDASLIPVLLAAGTVPIKLSAFPLLLIALLFYWSQEFLNIRRLLIVGVVSLLLLAPLMTVSVVTSGCPLYPSSALCMNVPWKLSAEKAHDALETIRGWDRWFGSPPSETNSLFWRFWQWLQLASLNIVMLLSLAISVPLAGFIFNATRRQKFSGTLWLSSLGLVGMVFIMLKAPLIRFGLGYFVMIPTIAIAIFVSTYAEKFNWQFPRHLLGLLLSKRLSQTFLLGLGVVGIISFTKVDIQSRLLLPPAMPTAEFEVKQAYDFEYTSPVSERGQCWDAPIPCAPGERSIRLRNPSRGLKAGFISAVETSE